MFIDQQMEGVIQVYEHLLAPFVLHMAKFSKRLNKEPKEDFTILSGMNKIVPKIVSMGEVRVPVDENILK